MNYIILFSIILNFIPICDRMVRGEDMIINTDSRIKALSYGRVTQKSVWHSGRSIEVNLLVYVNSGKLKLEVDGKAYSLSKGDLLFIPENIFYRPLMASKLEYFFIHFSADTAKAETEELKFLSHPLLPDGDYGFSFFGGNPNLTLNTLTPCAGNEAVRDIFLKISSLNIKSNRDRQLLNALVRELIITVSDESPSGNPLSPITVKIVDYIDERYFEDISLSALSDHFGISKSYIARLFKTELHTSSSNYLSRVRIANACRLLSFSDMSIGEISEATGFREQYYFSRVFKKELGMTPSEYKKRNLTA